jgi:alpha-tubulin suppressor-like RCC1 family protein
VPAQVQGLTGATAVTAGETHACALLAGGAAVCWGSNASGELGNRTITKSATPVQVWGLTGATAIAAASTRTRALLGDGTVKCWGENNQGANGIGRTTPVLVTDL